jgi:hypothetical protein
MASYVNSRGERHEVPLQLGMYREAFSKGLSLPQWLNQQFADADTSRGTAFQQILASEGIVVKDNKEFGIKATSLDAMLNGTTMSAAGGAIVKDALPASRILFPATFLQYIEDKLVADLSVTPNAFEGMIAVDDSINNDRFERPVLNFSKPEAARHAPITQLALPNTMLSITVSDISKKIPAFALGLEVSDQATRAASIDLVGLALARQAMVERSERAQTYMLNLMNGDADVGMGALSAIPGKVVTAQSFDATLAGKPGTLSQVAWINWLWKNHLKRRITHIVTDLPTAMAIENRTGKPVIVQRQSELRPRIDAIPTIIQPWLGITTPKFS